jgi:energy-coupling factor transporter ATP-binding protein EcfA2
VYFREAPVIRKLTVHGFKSIREAEVPMGPLTILIGANASGKSNLLEAIRVLQGLALGHPVRDVFDGRHEEATRTRWPGIRGGSKYARWIPSTSQAAGEVELRLGAEFDVDDSQVAWSICLDAEAGIVRSESLRKLGERNPVFDTEPCGTPSAQSVLTQFRGERAVTPANEVLAAAAAAALKDLQFLDPSPALLREYALPGARRMGDHGEQFASVVESLAADPATRTAYVSWLENLTPAHVSDVHFFKTDLGQRMFGVKENGLPDPIPALSLSDGTLRFAAMAAALFQPEPPGVLLIEEIENGVNATRLRLLAELLRQRSAHGRPQVIATTHSPLLLAFLPEEMYKHVIWFWRDPEGGSTRAAPLTEIPHLQEVLQRTPLNELFAQGWLEAAL